MTIKKNNTVIEAIQASKEAGKIFKKLGLDCPACKGASEDTIEKVAINNGLDLNELLKELNKPGG
jgi:hybrid cluster-associated redox disulfide protein